MPEPSRLLIVSRKDGVFCVRLRPRHVAEDQLFPLFAELHALVVEQGCRKLALSLGPDNHEFLYSVFLAKLITLRRILHERGGELLLCETTPEVRTIFEACKLDSQFQFVKDFDAALAHWQAQAEASDVNGPCKDS
jgi:hypothetical protein